MEKTSFLGCYVLLLVVCARKVENCAKPVWNFTPSLFVCIKLTLVMMLLIRSFCSCGYIAMAR